MADVLPHPSRRLYVEGKDDQYAVINVMLALRPNLDREAMRWIDLRNSGSDEQALKAFAAEVKGAPESKRIGIVLDADDLDRKRVADRWAQIRGALVDAQVSVPDEVPRDGWCVETAKGHRLGAWIMPDNASTGALEAFLARLVPPGDRCWTYAEQVVGIAKDTHEAPYELIHRAKAHIHTWLAWREKPGLPYGTAIQSGDLKAHADDTAHRFAAWFERLFLTDAL